LANRLCALLFDLKTADPESITQCLNFNLTQSAKCVEPKEDAMSDIGGLLPSQLPKLQRYARLLTRNRSDAEDLVQRCLVRALSRQHLWREGSDLPAWLCTILHHEFVSDMRQRAREREGLMIVDAKPVTMPHCDPEVSYRVRELQHAFGKLPAWQQEVVLRIGVNGEEYGDTATALGIPIGTVRSRLARARKTLRASTDHHCDQ
jgi:RNA polymerase sigma-70 factor (ECF subfamily)